MFFKKKERVVLLLTLVISALTLFGCGEPKVPENPEEEMIIISETGTVREILVESFDKDYYDIKELEAFVQEEVNLYNQKYSQNQSTPVMVGRVSILHSQDQGKCAKVEMTYLNCHAYAEYNEAILYYGSLAEGAYLMGESLIPEEYEENTVIITNQPMKLYAPGKVKWVSGSYPISADGSVDLTNLPVGEKVAIVLK